VFGKLIRTEIPNAEQHSAATAATAVTALDRKLICSRLTRRQQSFRITFICGEMNTAKRILWISSYPRSLWQRANYTAAGGLKADKFYDENIENVSINI